MSSAVLFVDALDRDLVQHFAGGADGGGRDLLRALTIRGGLDRSLEMCDARLLVPVDVHVFEVGLLEGRFGPVGWIRGVVCHMLRCRARRRTSTARLFFRYISHSSTYGPAPGHAVEDLKAKFLPYFEPGHSRSPVISRTRRWSVT